jgi:predicted NBD/HSP70 family sugar kinase
VPTDRSARPISESACTLVRVHCAETHVQASGGRRRYTAMLGRKASLKALRAALYRHRPSALRTTEFAQGASRRCCVDLHVLLQPCDVMLWTPICCRMASCC